MTRWRGNLSDLESALNAAGHYAKRDGKTVMVIGHTSFQQPVMSIVPPSDDLAKFHPMEDEHPVWLVDPDGTVHRATKHASDAVKARRPGS